MAIFGSLIGGLVMAGVGDALSYSGQQSTNQDNMAMNQANINAAYQRQQDAEQFNTASAKTAMDFSAQQVAQQEQFQTGMMTQAENYNTQMSDTAMQRRVQDLQNAGINPLLAIGQGGASAPTINAPQGSSAQGSQASISPGSNPGLIPMQNSMSAFGNLGGQINSSMQTAQAAAQVDLIKAQTQKTMEEANQQIPAQVDNISAQTGLALTQAKQVAANTNLVQYQMYETEARGAQEDSQAALNAVKSQLEGQNLEVLKGTRDALISAANSNAQAQALGLPKLQNMSEIQQTKFGQIINYLNTLLQPVNSAATVVGAVK